MKFKTYQYWLWYDKLKNKFIAYRSTQQYWYRIYIGECPVCGKNKGYRERVYGPKPAKPKDRYVHIPDTQTYDHCLERE